MSTYAVHIPSEHRWAVFQSSSGTMYSPTFSDELSAQLFALYYSTSRGRAVFFDLVKRREFDEPAQERNALAVVQWVRKNFTTEENDEMAGDYRKHTELLERFLAERGKVAA
jgi:ribosomal protein S18